MRLRLFHKLFLLVAVSALLAALAMAIVLSLNLKRGFADYLDARDDEQLLAFVDAAARQLANPSNDAALRAGNVVWPKLINDLVRLGEVPGARGAVPAARRNSGSIDREGNPAPRRGPPRRPPPDNFAMRLLVFDAEGRQVWGPKRPAQRQMLEQRIVLAGRELATARLLPRAPLPKNVDALFLQSQYRDASLLTVLLLALASIPAYFFARSGAARLSAVQRATTAIAAGDLSARVSVTGGDEISAMGENINSMALNLQQLDSSRRRWLAEISHELRTPLAVLIGELDALRDEVRPLNLLAVRSLSEEAQRLERVVNDLHFLALADMSGTSCTFAPCDAVAIVVDARARFAPAFSKAEISLSMDLGERSQLAVVWDGARVTQLLTNILSNSLRYTDSPGSAVLALKIVNGWVHLTLEDSAPAVPEADLERIFEPLYRVEASRARVSGGSGMGLAVSQSIVRAHGGSLSAATSALGGLKVEIILPVNALNHD